MSKPIVKIRNRPEYDIINIDFEDGSTLVVRTNKDGVSINCDTVGTSGNRSMFISPKMGNSISINIIDHK